MPPDGRLSSLLPSIAKLRAELAELDRQVALLRYVEAIRLYAAAHDGKPAARPADMPGAAAAGSRFRQAVWLLGSRRDGPHQRRKAARKREEPRRWRALHCKRSPVSRVEPGTEVVRCRSAHRLEEIDPADAWKPWEPTPQDPWGRKWAAHLYRRAAFGYSREDLIEAERLGPEGTLELLLEGRSQATEALETLIDVGRLAAERDDGGDQLRGWWLYCMLQGGHPLREKLTLFWHNHFATSLVKVQSPALMFRQNCLLREHALGKFGAMLQAVSRDGAMLIWLDSNSNIKGKPNENYARELMELFSLGVGNYTEKDVREAARAFTGWRTRRHRIYLQARAARQWDQDRSGQDGQLGRRRCRADRARAARGGPVPGSQAVRHSSSARRPSHPMPCSSRCASRSARAILTSRRSCTPS